MYDAELCALVLQRQEQIEQGHTGPVNEALLVEVEQHLLRITQSAKAVSSDSA